VGVSVRIVTMPFERVPTRARLIAAEWDALRARLAAETEHIIAQAHESLVAGDIVTPDWARWQRTVDDSMERLRPLIGGVPIEEPVQ
jgi:uncharacterized lipoprotein